MGEPIRIVLIDDHSVVREGVRMLIEDHPDLEVVGGTGSRAEAIALVAEKRPDIILLDLDLGGESSLDFLRELLDWSENSRVIILTGVRDRDVHLRGVQLGAVGVLLKSEAGSTLVKAIRKVHAGEAWLDRTLTAGALKKATEAEGARQSDPERERIATLTYREREIIALIADGAATKQIAERLSISEKTVRNHLGSVFGKLKISHRLELAMYAHKHGLATKANWGI